ncbi:(d)CMP kinase [Floricoccus penangensis]|uniref:Cytidylate kinase n=1 Tax=Floricoccus penangensis TaxID=1859475 RepID=A0A9Q5JGH7_9LACT|nr:(d)CMP kinase [Floricoccus penangensis]OFI46669.1 cytidylate kinase [Floricoccus penangensis]URZ86779.1 (d)CMP kinase [Floricoccus penangensis]
MTDIRIAIDGPASSGKSTVAKIIAQDMGLIYLDTGAMYRAVTYLALNNSLDKEEDIIELAQENPISFGIDSDGKQLVYLGEVDVSGAIRQKDVTSNVSRISAMPKIREYLVDAQRFIASHGGIVMDGRDIGTVVLPDAELKIFLVASVDERAERRHKQNQEMNIESDLEILKVEIAERDYKDSTRKTSPLVQAEDAIYLDTTGMSINEVVNFIEDKAKDLIK